MLDEAQLMDLLSLIGPELEAKERHHGWVLTVLWTAFVRRGEISRRRGTAPVWRTRDLCREQDAVESRIRILNE